MKDGVGEVRLDYSAELPRGGRNRKLTVENHHESKISAYQVNCLAPRDPDIRISGQERNYSQSLYRLDYVQANVPSGLTSLAIWFSGVGWLGMITLLVLKRAALGSQAQLT